MSSLEIRHYELCSPGFPVRLEEIEHMPLRHGVFAGGLECRAVVEFQHDRIWEFLAVRVGRVRGVEVGERKAFQGHSLVDIHGLGNGELE